VIRSTRIWSRLGERWAEGGASAGHMGDMSGAEAPGGLCAGIANGPHTTIANAQSSDKLCVRTSVLRSRMPPRPSGSVWRIAKEVLPSLRWAWLAEGTDRPPVSRLATASAQFPATFLCALRLSKTNRNDSGSRMRWR
jgi:hypothetical protein